MIRSDLTRKTTVAGRVLVLFVGLLLSATAMAQIGEAAAESLMKKSGLWQQVEGTGDQFAHGISLALAQSDPQLPADVTARMVAAASKSMSAERLRRDMRSELSKSIRPADLAPLNKWLDSPLGKRMTKIEAQLSSSDSAKLMEDGARIWKTAPAARQKALAAFIESAKLVEAMTNMSMNVSSAIAYGALSAAAGPSARSFADVRGIVTAQRDELMESMTTLIQALSAAAYAQVSNADLATYSAFMKSDAGSRYMDASIDAFDKAIVRAAADVGQSIVDSAATSKS